MLAIKLYDFTRANGYKQSLARIRKGFMINDEQTNSEKKNDHLDFDIESPPHALQGREITTT